MIQLNKKKKALEPLHIYSDTHLLRNYRGKWGWWRRHLPPAVKTMVLKFMCSIFQESCLFKQKCGENWSGNDQKAKDLAHGQILTKKRFNTSQIWIELKKRVLGKTCRGLTKSKGPCTRSNLWQEEP